MRTLLSLGALALVVAAVVWNVLSLERKAPLAAASTEQRPRYTVNNVTWTHLDAQGTAAFRITAARGQVFDDRAARFDQIIVHRFVAGQSPWQLTAPHGDVPSQEDRVRLYDAVIGDGTLQNGMTVHVETPELWVDAKNNTLYSDTAVTLTAPQWRAQSLGLRADLGGQSLALTKQTQVTYAPAP